MAAIRRLASAMVRKDGEEPVIARDGHACGAPAPLRRPGAAPSPWPSPSPLPWPSPWPLPSAWLRLRRRPCTAARPRRRRPGGGSRNARAMSSASGRSCGMAAISPATCRHASTRSATWPGFSTSPARESRSCISPGLIVGTDMAGDAGMRIGEPLETAANPSQPCPAAASRGVAVSSPIGSIRRPEAWSNTCRCSRSGVTDSRSPAAAGPASLTVSDLVVAVGQVAVHQGLRPQRLDQVDREVQAGARRPDARGGCR